jgi:hypothetical protein
MSRTGYNVNRHDAHTKANNYWADYWRPDHRDDPAKRFAVRRFYFNGKNIKESVA